MAEFRPAKAGKAEAEALPPEAAPPRRHERHSRTDRASKRRLLPREAGYTPTMARIVVISSAEIDREMLGEFVTPEDELFVVVPAVDQSRLAWLTNDDGQARRRAEAVGDTIAREARTDDVDVDVKPDVPLPTIPDAIAEHGPDRIVVALRRGEDATWLEDLGSVPGEIAGIPITRIAL